MPADVRAKTEETGGLVGSLPAGVGCPEPEPQKPIPDDPWEFCCDCVWTIDEHTKEVRPLVAEEERTGSYLEFLTRRWQSGGRQQWKKSRQIRVTWLLSALHLWEALKFKGVREGYQGKKFEDVDAYLEQRFYFIYLHIPPEYAKPRARYISGLIEVYNENEAEVATSFIHGLAEGENQVRQYTFTRLWMDEAAFHADQKESHGAAKPTLDGGGAILKTSSSGGNRTFFYKLAEEDVAPGPISPREEVFQGITAWQRNGFEHLFIHYSADIRKRPGTTAGDVWVAMAKEGQPTDLWQREMEGDDSVQPGMPVFCDSDRIRECVQDFWPERRLLGGFDPGFLWPFWYDLQIEELRDAEGRKYGEVLHYLHEYVKPNTEVYEFGAWVMAERERMYTKRYAHTFTDYGDDASNQRKETGQVARALRSMGFKIVTKATGPGGVVKGTMLTQRFISAACIEIDPSCKFLLTALRTGFTRGDDGQPLTGDAGHPYCDAYQAACQYPLQNLFDWDYAPRGPRVVSTGSPAPSAQPVRQQPQPDLANTFPGSDHYLGLQTRVHSPTPHRVQPGTHTDRVFTPKRYDPREATLRRFRRE